MTKRERVLASIQRQPLDMLPWQFDLTSGITRQLADYYKTDDVHAALDDHLVCTAGTAPGGFITESPGPGLVKNEFGVVWHKDARDRNVGDWGGVQSSPLSGPDLKGYHFPEGNAPGRWDHVPALRQKYPDHFLMAACPGLFEAGWALCGFENYLAYTAGEPEFIERLNVHLVEYACGVIRQLKGLNVDGVRVGDDWGFQNTLMLARGTWQKLYKPYYRKIYEQIHQLGMVVMIHSCGNITEIIPDLIEIGVEVIHPLQPEAMDVRLCQREFGKSVSFWGGLGTQSTLPFGTPEDCQKAVLELIKIFKDGGYILAPAGSISTETPAENVAAVVDVAKQQKKL